MTVPKPSVSVVIPAHNAQRTIQAAVESALAQIKVGLDVIVVDDGSQDATVDVVDAIGDPRVSIVQQENRGVAAARNRGIRHAKAAWVAFLDADDLWVPQKLTRQLSVLSHTPTAFAIHAGAYLVDDELRVLRIRRCDPQLDTLLHYLRFENLPAVSSSWIVRRDVFDAIGGFDPSLSAIEDWDMSIRLARYGITHSVPEPLTLYRQHHGNRSRELDIHVSAGFAILDQVFDATDLPPEIRERRAQVYARFYTMLAGGSLRTHRWGACARWSARALMTDPHSVSYLAGFPARRLRRRLARHATAAASPSSTLE